jgi:hypothetical protein
MVDPLVPYIWLLYLKHHILLHRQGNEWHWRRARDAKCCSHHRNDLPSGAHEKFDIWIIWIWRTSWWSVRVCDYWNVYLVGGVEVVLLLCVSQNVDLRLHSR